MKRRIIVSLLVLSSYLSFGQVKGYTVEATSLLKAGNNIIWKGDTIRKDSLIYVDIKTDSIRFKKINGLFTKWYYSSNPNLFKLKTDSIIKSGYSTNWKLQHKVDSLTLQSITDRGATTTNAITTSALYWTSTSGPWVGILREYGKYGGSYGDISFRNTNNSFNGDLSTTSITGNREYELPNNSGTIALTTDIPDISGKVDKVSGKALSDNNFTDADSTKLLGINLSLKIDTVTRGQANGVATLDSNAKVPMSQINDALLGSVKFQTTWSPATNTPTLPTPSSINKGFYWIASDSAYYSGKLYKNLDMIVSDGVSWQKIDNNNRLNSVFGRVGNVIANSGDYTTDQVTEGTNKYDKTVALSNGTGISVSGTYPNFTITNSSPSSGGTVTSISGGTGLTGGTITGSGTLAIDTAVVAKKSTVASMYQPKGSYAQDTAVVHKAGTQTITGKKTFSQDLTVNGLTVGKGAGSANFTTAFGEGALSNNNGIGNSGFGFYALNSVNNSLTGVSNDAFGDFALRSVVIGGSNCAFGENALYNVLGHRNSGFGDDILYNLILGSDNIALGGKAGNNAKGFTSLEVYLTKSDSSLFIGNRTIALRDSSHNEIVIGHRATGHGSNTATWGNTSITDHYFTGTLHGGSFVKSGGISSQFLKADGSVDASTYLTSQVYPGAGIPLSTGSAWGTSITNNSGNWNTAYTYSQVGHLPLSGGTLTGVTDLGYGTQFNVGINQNSASALGISNQNAGSSATANLYLGTYGNSWGIKTGSTANNGNKLEFFLDRSSPVTKMTLGVSGNLSIPSTTASTSTTTGALVVGGGLGVAGAINAGGSVTAAGAITAPIGNFTSSDDNALNLYRTVNNTNYGISSHYFLNNSLNVKKEYAFNDGAIESNTAGAENGSYSIYTSTAGSLTEKLHIASTGLITINTLTAAGAITAPNFIKSGGTSAQYLLADGSTTTTSGAVYKGQVNGSTGSGLADGTGTTGWYYACSTAGTHNYGSGNITLAVGDQLYYNGTIWIWVPGAGAYTLPIATGSVLGGVKSSASVAVDGSGIMSVSTAYDASGAAAAITPTTLGLVIGTNVLAQRTFGTAANSATGDFVAARSFGSAANNNTGDFEVPLTFSTGLTRTGNTITNNITQYTDAMADSRVTAGIAGKENTISTGSTSQYWRGDKSWQTLPTTLPASDVYSWAKASTKPAYTYSEVGAQVAGTYSTDIHSNITALNAVSGTNTGDQDLSGKVDKVTGKGLSTNDYTTAEAIKLAAITGTNTGDQTNISGTAAFATALATERLINGVNFDGTSDITITAEPANPINNHQETEGTTDITGSTSEIAMTGMTTTYTPKGQHALVMFCAPFTVTANSQGVTLYVRIQQTGYYPVEYTGTSDHIFTDTQSVSFQKMLGLYAGLSTTISIWWISSSSVHQNGATMSARRLTILDLP